MSDKLPLAECNITSCETIDNTEITLTNVDSNYILVPACTIRVPKCLTCEHGGCKTCLTEYFLDNNACSSK